MKADLVNRALDDSRFTEQNAR